jgi:hypothetical protein
MSNFDENIPQLVTDLIRTVKKKDFDFMDTAQRFNPAELPAVIPEMAKRFGRFLSSLTSSRSLYA